MRYDADHKQRTHEKVVAETANAIREHGPDKVGVATLMARAGLTHGGFYTHFSSKEDLIEQAIDHMFKERLRALEQAASDDDPARGLTRYIDLYLSRLHRDHRDRGCPLVALSGDMARMPDSAKKRFEAGFLTMESILASMIGRLDVALPKQHAKSLLMEMIGVLTMARAVSDNAHSNTILDLAKASIKDKLGLS